MALTSLAQIKSFLNICHTDTDRDAWLDSLREAAEANVKAYCKRDFEFQNYTEYYSGNNTRFLVLRQRPVSTIFNVYLDSTGGFGTTPGSFNSTALLTQGTDYSLQYDTDQFLSSSGVLIRLNGLWPELNREFWVNRLRFESGPHFGNIKITYAAGYETIPQDLQFAVCWIVSFMRRNITVGGLLGSEKIGDYSYELMSPRFMGNMPPELGTARQLLTRYRESSF